MTYHTDGTPVLLGADLEPLRRRDCSCSSCREPERPREPPVARSKVPVFIGALLLLWVWTAILLALGWRAG